MRSSSSPDFGGQGQGQPGLDGDIVGQLTEIELVAPDGQRFIGRRQQTDGLVIAEMAVGMVVQESTEASPADPAAQVGIGITSSTKAQEAPLGQATGKGPVPLGTEDLEEGIDPADDLRTALDQARA